MQPDTEPHPVAGGQVRGTMASPSDPSRLDEMVLDYEVWVDPRTGDAWVDVSPSPAVLPVRLHAATVGLLESSLREHALTTRRTVGVGVDHGTLLVALRQEWPLASTGVMAVLLVSTLVLAAVAIRGRRRAAQALAFAQHQATSREDERTRVAREIHDGPLQDLALLARTVAPDEQRRIREVGAELRALATDLRPPALDRLGLVSALSDLADRWARAPTPLAVRVQSDGFGRLPPDVELALYRVAQEALTNAASHGGARTAWIFLREQDARHGPHGAVDLVIRDDGRGLPNDVDPARNTLVGDGHFGLAGMEERARAFGGAISVGSGPGGFGTEVRLHVPASGTRRRFWRRPPPESRACTVRPRQTTDSPHDTPAS